MYYVDSNVVYVHDASSQLEFQSPSAEKENGK